MKKLIIHFIVVILLYLSISFFELNINPNYWDSFTRFIMSIVGMCIIVCGLVDYINDN